MKMQESAENYLEAILVVGQQKGTVRSIDIAHYLNFSKPSISRAMGLLRDNGYIDVDDYGQITLTANGRQIADAIYERHTILTEFLELLGVPSKTAQEDACRIEHVISPESFTRFKAHVEQMRAEA
jgi:Mn-dependent DtxR family transcriptional regulator